MAPFSTYQQHWQNDVKFFHEQLLKVLHRNVTVQVSDTTEVKIVVVQLVTKILRKINSYKL